jgi:hypothetical protein
MVGIDDVTAVKKKLDRLRRESDRAAGVMDGIMKRLKDEFGCHTLKEAKAKLKEMQAQEAKAKSTFNKAFNAFEKEWGEVLNDGGEATEDA